MKKLIISASMMLVLCAPAIAQMEMTSVENAQASTEAPMTEDAVKAQQLLSRLDEINTMDKSDLSFSEKKELRQEVRSIKKGLGEVGGGVYISGGAIIIILILLLILF